MKSEKFATALAQEQLSQFAQTPADFITKLHISLKEANETTTWLDMLHTANAITDKEFESMSKDLNEIIAILIASLKTIKKNINTRRVL